MNENPYMMLAKVILPKEMTEYFDLTKVRTDEYNGEPRIHLYLDEKDKAPDDRTDLSSNGFYEESCMNDFPIREYRTVLHVRRRRWKDTEGKSVSKDWQMVAKGTRYSKEFATFLKEFLGYRQMVAKGTRYSKEFATFLKEFLGYIPNYGQIAPETISRKG